VDLFRESFANSGPFSRKDNECKPGGFLVEKWVRGRAAEKGCNFTLFGMSMDCKITQNWFREGLYFQTFLKNV